MGVCCVFFRFLRFFCVGYIDVLYVVGVFYRVFF